MSTLAKTQLFTVMTSGNVPEIIVKEDRLSVLMKTFLCDQTAGPLETPGRGKDVPPTPPHGPPLRTMIVMLMYQRIKTPCFKICF